MTHQDWRPNARRTLPALALVSLLGAAARAMYPGIVDSFRAHSTLSGLITLALGLLVFGDDNPGMVFYSLLLLAAGLAWWAAAAVFATVDEFAGETAGGDNALRQAFRSLGMGVLGTVSSWKLRDIA